MQSLGVRERQDIGVIMKIIQYTMTHMVNYIITTPLPMKDLFALLDGEYLQRMTCRRYQITLVVIWKQGQPLRIPVSLIGNHQTQEQQMNQVLQVLPVEDEGQLENGYPLGYMVDFGVPQKLTFIMHGDEP